MCPKLIFCPFYFGNKLCPKCIKLTVSRIPLPILIVIAKIVNIPEYILIVIEETFATNKLVTNKDIIMISIRFILLHEFYL